MRNTSRGAGAHFCQIGIVSCTTIVAILVVHFPIHVCWCYGSLWWLLFHCPCSFLPPASIVTHVGSALQYNTATGRRNCLGWRNLNSKFRRQIQALSVDLNGKFSSAGGSPKARAFGAEHSAPPLQKPKVFRRVSSKYCML